MLFNSFVFVFFYLPVTLAIHFWIGRRRPLGALFWMTGASLLFYAWWHPPDIFLLVGSITGNFAFGYYLAKRPGTHAGRVALTFGIAANLGLLGYFKYGGFFVGVIENFTGALGFAAPLLPLAISFYTFTQIAYLVDAYHGEAKYGFLEYILFVTFFPHLIAGPIVHHWELIPQFGKVSFFRFRSSEFSIGLTIFVLGLFKKTVIADTVATFVTPVYAAAKGGAMPTFFEAWGSTLAYSMQLYFDFSGYSDMAIGLARMVGVKLPLNFNSPYKAVNITDFWRRWHMTLSRFLRDFLYIPLGGNRKGEARRNFNLMVTMLLGGLWHGAGWQFIVWGGLHGLYLVINQTWMKIRKAWWGSASPDGWIGRWAGIMLTFFVVNIAWVFFRAADFPTAGRILRSMFGMNGLSFGAVFSRLEALLWLPPLLLIVFLAPNTQQIMDRFSPALEYDLKDGRDRRPEPYCGPLAWFKWMPTWRWAVLGAVLFVLSLLCFARSSEFIYFNF